MFTLKKIMFIFSLNFIYCFYSFSAHAGMRVYSCFGNAEMQRLPVTVYDGVLEIDENSHSVKWSANIQNVGINKMFSRKYDTSLVVGQNPFVLSMKNGWSRIISQQDLFTTTTPKIFQVYLMFDFYERDYDYIREYLYNFYVKCKVGRNEEEL